MISRERNMATPVKYIIKIVCCQLNCSDKDSCPDTTGMCLNVSEIVRNAVALSVGSAIAE